MLYSSADIQNFIWCHHVKPLMLFAAVMFCHWRTFLYVLLSFQVLCFLLYFSPECFSQNIFRLWFKETLSICLIWERQRDRDRKAGQRQKEAETERETVRPSDPCLTLGVSGYQETLFRTSFFYGRSLCRPMRHRKPYQTHQHYAPTAEMVLMLIFALNCGKNNFKVNLLWYLLFVFLPEKVE